MDKLTFKLEVFEGPLDLLLHLISKNKVSIYDIPIVTITNQYFEALSVMQELDLEISSEFCVMAAQLLYIKSKMLLPKPTLEEEEDPREELAKRLLEYQKYKQASQKLKEREFYYKYMYFKEPDEIEPLTPPPPDSYPIEKLMEAFYDVLERTKRRAPPPKKNFDGIVKRRVVSVRDRATRIVNMLGAKKRVSFTSLFDGDTDKPELVATFLALLELIRMNMVYAQDENGQIVLSCAQNGDNVNGEDSINGEEFTGNY